MKKLLLLIASFMLFIAVIVSCGDDDKSPTATGDGELIWGDGASTAIIFDGNVQDISELVKHIGGLVGELPEIKTSASTAGKNEIILGETDRALSTEAYRKLDRNADLFEISSRGESAYLIYAKDGSLAVAYSDVIGRYAALEYLYTVKAESFKADGVVSYSCFGTSAYVSDVRDAERELRFAEIEKTLGKDATDAIREAYALYSEDLYLWLANLYDPITGGFYYSGSARNNEGFLPDLESTGQALALMDNSGLSSIYDGTWAMLLPDDIKTGLLDFARNMQDKDGYFYHPQWGKNISGPRRGRDAGWARNIIEGLGEEPYYTYISERVDDVSAILTENYGKSTVTQVSKVVSVASTSAELKSEAAFREWLDNAKISEDSYSTFHNLNSRTTEIKKAGLWNFLLDYLREHQYSNGLWEPTICYNSVNGLMKISSFFGKNFPNAEAALSSVMTIMQMDALEEIEGITFVYNPWVCVYNIINSCSTSEQARFRGILKDNAPALIAGTTRKLAAFRREDGGFSYHQDKTASVSQGELVAVDGTLESDVNATGMAISSVIKYMLRVYQITPPQLYYEIDSLYFVSTLESLGEIVKDVNEYEDPEVITFDNYDPAYGEEEYGVVKKPHDSIKSYVGDEEILGDSYAWFTSSIVQNPDPNSKSGDLVLYSKDFVYPEFSKKEAKSQSSTIINFVNARGVGNCYVLDLDMWCDEVGTTTAPVMQIIYHQATTTDNSMWVNVYSYEKDGKTYLRIEDNFVGLDGVRDTATAGNIPVGEWFNLRIEAYKFTDDSGKLKVRIKFYVNGEYTGECDSSHTTDGGYTDFTVNAVKLAYYRTDTSAFYLNNIYASKMTKQYVAGGVSTEPLGPSEYNFESGEIDTGIKGHTYSTSGEADGRESYVQESANSTEMAEGLYGTYFTVTADPKRANNKVLKLTTRAATATTASGITLYPTTVGSGRVHIVEYDYMLGSNTSAAASILGINFLDTLGLKIGGTATGAHNIVNTGSYERGVFQIGNTIAGADGVTPLDANFWYKIRIAWDQDTNVIRYLYSIDGGETWYHAAKDGERKSATRIGAVQIICNAYNNTGEQYLDNLSYVVTDTMPTAKSGAPDMGYDILVTPGGNTVYDFETNVLESGDHINIEGHVYLKNPSPSSNSSYDELRDHKIYNSVTGAGTYDGKYGVSMSLAVDPTNEANKVLKMHFTHTGSTSPTIITVASSTVNDKATVDVIEFDYYLHSQTRTGSTTPFKIQFHDELDRPVGSSFNFIQQLATPVSTTAAEGPRKAFRGNGVPLYSKTWYKIRIIRNHTEGTIDFYYSTDKGATFVKLGETKDFKSTTYSPSVSLRFGTYNWDGVQCLDNISYKNLDAVPEMTVKTLTPADMGVAVSGGSTVYDFETDAINTGDNIRIDGNVYEKPLSDRNYSYENDHKKYNSITNSGANDGKLGVSLSIVSDTSVRVGKLLKLHYTEVETTEPTTVSLGAGTVEENATVAVLQFDYYLFSQISSGTDAALKIRYNNASGYGIGSALSLIASNGNPTSASYPSVRAFAYNGAELYSKSWYTLRIVWDMAEGKVYYYYSEDEGATFILAGEAVGKTEKEIPDSINLEFVAKGFSGVQYIDNLSFAVLEDAPEFTEGAPIARPENRPTGLGPTRYDFETESVTEGILGYTYSTASSTTNRIVYEQTSVNSTGTPSGEYGLYFNLSKDVAGHVGGVLKLSSTHAGGATAGTVDVYPTFESEGNVHIVEYDYYLESSVKSSSVTLLGLNFLNLAGQKIGGSLTLSYGVENTNNYYIGAFQMGTTSTTALETTAPLDACRWYKMRVVWDRESGNLSYLYSLDGNNYYRAAADTTKTSTADVLAVQFVCNTYNNTGVQYLDNLSYKVTDTVPAITEGSPSVDNGTVSSGSGKAYDFETDTIESGRYISILGNAYTAEGNQKVEYDSITADGISGEFLGISMSISQDPENAAGRALKVVTRKAESALPSSITIGSAQSDKNNKVTVFEFDYYLESVSSAGKENLIEFNFLDEYGRPLFALDIVQTLEGDVEVSGDDSYTEAFSVNGVKLFSKVWYKIRVVLDRAEHKLYCYASDNGGRSYETLGTYMNADVSRFVNGVEISIGADVADSVFYIDNLKLQNLLNVPNYTEGALRDPRPSTGIDKVPSNMDGEGWDEN